MNDEQFASLFSGFTPNAPSFDVKKALVALSGELELEAQRLSDPSMAKCMRLTARAIVRVLKQQEK